MFLDVRCATRKNKASVLRVASAWKIGANAAITGMRRPGSSGAPTSLSVLISTHTSTEICQDIWVDARLCLSEESLQEGDSDASERTNAMPLESQLRGCILPHDQTEVIFAISSVSTCACACTHACMHVHDMHAHMHETSIHC
jgi:hypothetical protein